MPDQFRLVVNRGELDRLLTSPSGPVARDLAQRSERIAADAVRRAPRKTGALAGSIGWRISEDDDGLRADVFATLPYAVPVESGHRAADGSRVSPRRFLRPALFAAASPRGNR